MAVGLTRREMLAALLCAQAVPPSLVRMVRESALGHRMNYYVSTAGNNSNPGTLAQPFLTLAKGISVLTAGDTLYVRAGTYAEALTSFPSGSSWAFPVTIAAYSGETVTIRPSSGGNVLTITGGAHHLIFDGLILDAVNTIFTGSAITDQWGNVVYIGGGAHHIRIQSSELKNAPGQGIDDISDGFDEFLNLDVHDNGRVYQLTHGIYLDTNNCLVEGCRIYNNAAWGLQVYGTRAHLFDNVIRRNRVYDNTVMGNGGGISLSGVRNSAYNNVLWGNDGGYAMEIAFLNPVGNKLLNNTCTGAFGIFINADSSGAVVRNNITSTTTDALVDRGSGSILSNNLTSAPSFVDAGGHDYRLQPSSAAIDAGTSLSEVSSDFDGGPRPQGAGFDIGAYEYSAGAFYGPVASVALLTASPVTHRLTWTQAGTFTGTYTIERCAGVGCTSFTAVTTGRPYSDPKVWDFTDVTPGTTYRYRVTAVDGGSVPSAVVTLGTLPSGGSPTCEGSDVPPGDTTPGAVTREDTSRALPPWTRQRFGRGVVPTAPDLVDSEVWT